MPGYARAVPAPDYQALLAELSGWQDANGVVPTMARYLPGPENEVDLLVPRGGPGLLPDSVEGWGQLEICVTGVGGP